MIPGYKGHIFHACMKKYVFEAKDMRKADYEL